MEKNRNYINQSRCFVLWKKRRRWCIHIGFFFYSSRMTENISYPFVYATLCALTILRSIGDFTVSLVAGRPGRGPVPTSSDILNKKNNTKKKYYTVHTGLSIVYIFVLWPHRHRQEHKNVFFHLNILSVPNRYVYLHVECIIHSWQNIQILNITRYK